MHKTKLNMQSKDKRIINSEKCVFQREFEMRSANVSDVLWQVIQPDITLPPASQVRPFLYQLLTLHAI